MQLGSHCLFVRLFEIAMPGGLAAGTLHCKFSERENKLMFSVCAPIFPTCVLWTPPHRTFHPCPSRRFASLAQSCCDSSVSLMLPSKPPEVSDEDWELELPSILGSAHPDFHGPAETPSPRSLISVASDPSSLQLTSSPQSTVLYATDNPPHIPRSFQADTDTSADTPFQEWNIPGTYTELILDGSAQASLPPPLEQDPTAEHLAHFFLQTGKASFHDISRLLDLLPEKTSAKRRGPLCLDGDNRKCFSTGAFTSTGVQNNVTLFPRVTAALAGIMRGMCPEATFASLTLQRNLQLQCHRDIGNEPELLNTVIPCSRWVGGCLWLQGHTHWIKNLGQVLCFAYSCPMCSFHRTFRTQLRHGRQETEPFSLATLLAICSDYALKTVNYSN